MGSGALWGCFRSGPFTTEPRTLQGTIKWSLYVRYDWVLNSKLKKILIKLSYHQLHYFHLHKKHRIILEEEFFLSQWSSWW